MKYEKIPSRTSYHQNGTLKQKQKTKQNKMKTQ